MYTTFGQPLAGTGRLICYPYAGAGSGIYHDWIGRFPGLDLVAARLPGRDNLLSEPAITDFPSLIKYLLDGIWPHTDVPFILFGHSMGGLLAFEVSRRLRALGRLPALLVISATEAPQSLGATVRHEAALNDADVLELLRRNGGTPSEALANAELMQLVIQVMRADLRMLASYRYRPLVAPLGVPTHLYFGQDDDVDPERLMKGWEIAVRGEVMAHEFPGGHFFVHSARDAVIDTLGRHIAVAVQGG